MLEYQGYLGVVEADEGAFVGRVAGLRDVVTFEGATFAEVEQAFRDSVDDYLAFCAERGEPPDRPYSGKIPLRLAPTHRRAAAQAQAAGVSLNHWIAGRLEQVLLAPRQFGMRGRRLRYHWSSLRRRMERHDSPR